MRLIDIVGKIERSDWNVKEIEKKIEENKMGRGARQQKVERVPKWSREQVCLNERLILVCKLCSGVYMLCSVSSSTDQDGEERTRSK